MHPSLPIVFTAIGTLLGTANASPALPTATPAPRLRPRDNGTCSTAEQDLSSLVDTAPKVPLSVLSFAGDQITETASCSVPYITGSLADEYSSWASEYLAWQRDHTEDFSIIAAGCTDVPSLSGLGQFVEALCTELEWGESSATPRGASLAMGWMGVTAIVALVLA